MQSWVELSDQEIASTFNLKESEVSDFWIVKNAFTKMIRQSSHKPQDLKKLNHAYCETIRKLGKKEKNEVLWLINQADQDKLGLLIANDKSLLNKMIDDYPPIYLAARAGNKEIVEFFLKNGCSINFENHRSTPMHAASYYGHKDLIVLLLRYGIPTDITNYFGHQPLEEAATVEIIKLLEDAKQHKVMQLKEKLCKDKLQVSQMMKFDKNKNICYRKIFLNKWKKLFSKEQFVDAFHGTKYANLYSIAKHGLKPPGEITHDGRRIQVRQCHIPENVPVDGHQNWAKAVFLSPSIFYAADEIYSEQFIDKPQQESQQSWLPVIQAKVKKGCYQSKSHTFAQYQHRDNEPHNLEYRVQYDSPETAAATLNSLIMRTQQQDKVHVVAILLIKKSYLQNNTNYFQTMETVLQSQQEKNLRDLL